MDILRSPTIWVAGRCYRVITPMPANYSTYIEDDAYPDEEVYEDGIECGTAEDTDYNIEQLPNGKYSSSFAVASTYVPYLIGSKGATRRRIESETYTQIRVPWKGQSGDIVVVGKDIKTVRTARLKLELLVDQARSRQPFTHFLSIPCNNKDIQDGFLQFQKEVLEKCGSCRGVDKSIFQTPSKLHLTVCVIVLADDRERTEAMELLQEAHQTIISDFRERIGTDNITAEIRGVEYMNDDPGEVNVLYGKVIPTSISSSDFQQLADAYVDYLVKAGLIKEPNHQVKLHLTLMNTSFRRGEDDSKDKNERDSFDGRDILNDFKDFYFGKFELRDVHLSVRHSVSADGYYSSTGKLSWV